MLGSLIDFLSKPTPEKNLIGTIILILFFLSIFIDISKIPINPWKHIIRGVSKIFNSDIKQELKKNHQDTHDEIKAMRHDFNTKHQGVLDDLNAIKDEQAAIKFDQDEGQKKAVRRAILKFADECRRGENHSQERFNEVLRDIDEYERLCKRTDDHNTVAEEAVSFIKEIYRKRLEKNDFLL